MDEWKEKVKEYVIYCKEDRKEAWINDINALDLANFSDLTYRKIMYEDQKKSFIKTAEIMKALEDGESWKQIGTRLMEGHEYCQYPVGIIGHMMLLYSKNGIEFVKTIIGKGIELMTDLQEEFYEELEKENGKELEEIKLKYKIQDDNVVLRLCSLKSALKSERKRTMNYDELLAFLKSAMNYGEMQIWLLGKQIEEIELTLNDKLKKFFELKSDDDIIRLYDIEQNYDQNNLDGIKRNLEKNQKIYS